MPRPGLDKKSLSQLTLLASAAAAIPLLICVTVATADDLRPRVAYLANILTDYSKAELDGIKAVTEKAGGTVTTFNADFDPQKQYQQCEDAIATQRYNVMVVNPADSVSAVPCASQAAAAGIKVVSIEGPIGSDETKVGPQVPEVIGAVGMTPTDDAGLSLKAVDEACKGIDPCDWAVTIANKTNPADATRLQYFESHLSQHPNVKLVSVSQTNYDPSQTASTLPDVLRAHPHVHVITTESDTNALVAEQVVKELGLHNVRVIGNGASRQGVEAVRKGDLFATVANFPMQMGEAAATLGIAALQGKTIPNPTVEMRDLAHKSGVAELLTQKTLGNFTGEWGVK